ncbi:MAG: hypothetical protein AB7O65_09485 [Candidatus Korobacteraceae bacterium]
MKNIRDEALLWMRLAGFVAIWAVILYATDTGLSINWEALKKFPDAVTVYIIGALVFTHWLWRLRIFQGWLVPFPDLQGTWEGEMKSTWKDPATGVAPSPIPVVLVIRQTFSSVSCVLYSHESESQSTAAQFSRDDESGTVRLNYNYTNRPRATIRDRSAIHDGASRLRIISTPERRLEGEYWTSRCTAGDIALKFRSRELAETCRK